MTPVQYIANFPSEFLDTIVTGVETKKELIKENPNLKDELLLLQAKEQQLAFLEEENNNLRSLLGSSIK